MSFLLVLITAFARAEDRCASTYDPKNPAVSLLESQSGGRLISSQWFVCDGHAYTDATKCGAKVSMKFKLGLEKSKLALSLNGLGDDEMAKLAKSAGVQPPVLKFLIGQGIPFSASLCARANDSAYVRLVGMGVANGKTGIIEISKDDRGVRVSDLNTDAGASK